VLSRNVSHDRRARFRQCAHLTSGAAEMAARLIIHQQPELIRHSGNDFFHKTDTRIGAMLTRVFASICLKRK
jgi:hypothetical protein